MTTSSLTMVTINLMPVFKKLVHGNHTLWKAQVPTVLRGAQLDGFLDEANKAPTQTLKTNVQKGDLEDVEEVNNSAYDLWKAQEQQVLSYLLTSVSHDVLVQVATIPTAAEVWKHIETSFASQSHARVINTCMALATT
jgi:K+-sensing histidine kinase KdpD